MINIAGNNIIDIAVEDNPIKKAYIGNQLVWEKNSGSDFIEVEYIENTSTAYIDTGFVPNNNTRVETQVIPSALNTVLFGARKLAAVKNAKTFTLWFLSDIIRTDFNGSQTTVISNPYVDTLYTIDKNKNVTTINGTTKTITNGTFSSEYTMYIFNVHQPSTETRYFKGKLKSYFKVYDNGTLVRNYVPAYQISTQQYGLLDKLNNTFNISPNGVVFTGPAIE